MATQRHTRRDNPIAPEKVTNSVVQKNVRDIKRKQAPVRQTNVRPPEVAPIQKQPPVNPEQIEINVSKKIDIIVAETPKIENKFFDHYLGFGGVGDAMLLLGACWNNPRAHSVFFANNPALTKDFFRLFGVTATVMANVMGTPMANIAQKRLQKLSTFKQSAHLADDCYYEDWRNEDKYISRIINYIPQWRSKFGLLAKNLIAIAPSGSHRDNSRQRYLEKHEYESLVRKYLNQGYEVYGIGSDKDWREYHMPEKGVWWATNRILRDWQGNIKNHELADMLRIINSATEVISMDTWMKTYSMIAGIPTTVIATRWHEKYLNYGEDVTDWIFLNPKIWPQLKVARIEDLLI